MSQIVAVGSYLPSERVSNADLSAFLDTSDEWIRERTGIVARRRADSTQNASHLGTLAAQDALTQAGLTANDIDGIIVATSTPDHVFPATAALIQANLGVTRGFAFDVSAACTGFIAALLTADGFIKSGRARCMLVIGAETFMRLLDDTDRSTYILFGDGAGAMVLTPKQNGSGIVQGFLHTNGAMAGVLYTDAQDKVRMNGREVFRHAVDGLVQAITQVLTQSGISLQQVRAIVPHQANSRIIEALAKRLNFDPQNIVNSIAEHGNTSAASIPLAWQSARAQWQTGDYVIMAGMGSGFTIGAILVQV